MFEGLRLSSHSSCGLLSFRSRLSLPFLCLTALLAGCATPVTQRVAVDPAAQQREERDQMRMALRSEWDMTLRLWRVGYPMLAAAAPDCKDRLRPSLGLFVARMSDFPEKNRPLLAEAIGIDSQTRVWAAYPRGAGEVAGVRDGDVVISSSAGSAVPGETATQARVRMPIGKPVTLQLRRGNDQLSVDVVPDQVCDYRLQYQSDSAVNAYADGEKIIVTRGMMRFASDDRELALVVGHEVGHNTMGHSSKKQINAGLGLAVDILVAVATGVNTQGAFSQVGAGAYSQDFEREADYVGMYYLARAGYPTEGAGEFWRRMATEHPGSIKSNHAASHPATAERFLALSRTGTEIRAKADAGAALAPNLANK